MCIQDVPGGCLPPQRLVQRSRSALGLVGYWERALNRLQFRLCNRPLKCNPVNRYNCDSILISSGSVDGLALRRPGAVRRQSDPKEPNDRDRHAPMGRAGDAGRKMPALGQKWTSFVWLLGGREKGTLSLACALWGAIVRGTLLAHSQQESTVDCNTQQLVVLRLPP